MSHHLSLFLHVDVVTYLAQVPQGLASTAERVVDVCLEGHSLNPDEIVQLAREGADERFEERVAAILAATDGEATRLVQAAELLGTQAASPEVPEHIAFTYLAAAFERLTY